MLAEDEEIVEAFEKKNNNIEDCCYMAADAWKTFSQDNLKKAWNCWEKRKENEGIIVDILQAIPGFSDCNKDDAQLWLESNNYSGFQILNNEKF